MDVRDVAAAHLLAATLPAAHGRRYILSQRKHASAHTVTDLLRVGQRVGAAEWGCGGKRWRGLACSRALGWGGSRHGGGD